MSVLVLLCSRGPVFFKQERVGLGRRRFMCYKFRTMVVRADTDVHLAWRALQQAGPDIFWTPRNGGHWIATRAEDPALLIYTSGTTGNPASSGLSPVTDAGAPPPPSAP